MFKFITRLFAPKPGTEDRVGARTEWILVKRAVENSGNPVLLAQMRSAAQRGYDVMVKENGGKSMLYPTCEGLETYSSFCLRAFYDTRIATLRPEVREPVDVGLKVQEA
jgi:hypothetical protein